MASNKAKEPAGQHYSTTIHNLLSQTIGIKSNKYKRMIKEAITIRQQGGTMNRYMGQYHLSHVFDDLLLDKISRNTQAAGNAVAKHI